MNIWWKLAVGSAMLDILTLPVWIVMGFGRFPESYPIPLVVPLGAILALPVVYLLIFALWHWRTRYAGKHHLVWTILFVITAWPLVATLPGSVFTALVYFFLHLVPDIRGKGAYATPAPVVVTPPASLLPKSYQLAKSVCVAVGWSMVFGGVLSAAIGCIGHYAVWNRFEAILPAQIGKEFTVEMSKTLWLASQIGKTTVVVSLISVIAAAVGAVLIQVSQRMRWRLMDEQEKEGMRKSI